MKPPAFFDVEERLARLSGLGDQLEGSKNRWLISLFPDFGLGGLVLMTLDDDFFSAF